MTALRADGFGGQADFDGEIIRIERRGVRARVFPAREFPVAHVLRVDFSPASTWSDGYIRFALPLEETKKPTKDPNHIRFAQKGSEQFEALLAAVNRFVEERGELDESMLTALRESHQRLLDEEERVRAERNRATAEKWQRKGAIAVYDKHLIRKGVYQTTTSFGLGVKRPIAGARAEFESGSDRTRPTLTRIGAGALLAGPVGAVAGGMFKKDRTKAYVTIAFEDGATVIIDGPAKDEKKMREFAAQVNQIADLEEKWAAESNPEIEVEEPESFEGTEERLMKLKRLHEAGVLDDEQYAEKSAPLIAQL